jgi:hypothetical protein
MKGGLFQQDSEYHNSTQIDEADDLLHFLVEIEYRLRKEKDFKDYIEPKIDSACTFLKEK